MPEIKSMQCPQCREIFDFDGSLEGTMICPYCQANFTMKRRRTATVKVNSPVTPPAEPPTEPSAAAAVASPAGAAAPVAAAGGVRRTGGQVPVSAGAAGAVGSASAMGVGAGAAPVRRTAARAAVEPAGAGVGELAAGSVEGGGARFTTGVWLCLGGCALLVGLIVTGLVVHMRVVHENAEQVQAASDGEGKLQKLRVEHQTLVEQLSVKQKAARDLDDQIAVAQQQADNRSILAPVDPRPTLQARLAALQTESAKLQAEGEALKAMPAATTETVARAHKSAVVIVVDGTAGFGTGFVVGENRVITNFHVVADDPEVVVKFLAPGADANAKPAFVACKSVKVLAVDRDRDLALLEVDFGTPTPPSPLTLQPTVSQGEKICAIGNPGAIGQMLEHTISEGIVSALDRTVQNKRFHQISAAINPGNSGGPVFNMQGEVVGVATLKVTGADNLGFMIPVSDVQTFLQTWQQHAVGASFAEFLLKLNPVKFTLKRIRETEGKYLTDTKINYAICDAACDSAGNLWIGDIEGNRLVAVAETTLKQAHEIGLSARPAAFSINSSGQVAWVLYKGGTQLVRVDLSTGRETKTITLDIACTGLLKPIDSQTLLSFRAGGMLMAVNTVTGKAVDFGGVVKFPNQQPLTLSVSSSSVDLVCLDRASLSMVVHSETVANVRQLATWLAQADAETDGARRNAIYEQIQQRKYFTKDSQLPVKYIKSEESLFAFTEGPNNTCYLGNAIFKGPAPYRSAGALPSMLQGLGASEEDTQRFGFLDDLTCTSDDFHYGATALAVYDLTTNKPLMPLPFVSTRTMFSHDGKTLYFFVEREDGTTHLIRFPWKEVPAFDWTHAVAPTPAH